MLHDGSVALVVAMHTKIGDLFHMMATRGTMYMLDIDWPCMPGLD